MTTSPSPLTRTTSLEIESVRTTSAHVFFWIELCVAAGVSVVGNAAQAVLHTTAIPAVAAVVAVIPPLALLAAVHGVALLAKAPTVSTAARRAATALTVLIAAGAFWMSFTALRALAVTAGVPPAEAWLWPLIVEGSMTQSTIALLTLAHAHPPDAEPPSNPLPSKITIERPPSPKAPLSPPHQAPTPLTTVDADNADDRPRLRVLAAMICDQDPRRRRDPETVASILEHHDIDGWSAARIARELGTSRSTVSRILRDARGMRAHAVVDGAHGESPRAHAVS